MAGAMLAAGGGPSSAAATDETRGGLVKTVLFPLHCVFVIRRDPGEKRGRGGGAGGFRVLDDIVVSY